MLDWGRRAVQHIQPLVFVISALLFCWHLGRPTTLNFDETHYVPAAKDLLQGVTVLNLEHPPLAKYFMALGIGVFGDNPVGWRIMSALFGCLTLVAIVALADALEFSLAEQWMIAILTLSNCMLFIMARICMLDIFLLFFIYSALATFCEVWRDDERSRAKLVFCGANLGLAMACKWSALYVWMGLVGLAAGVLIASWRLRKPSAIKSAVWLSVTLFILPFLTYYITYIPLWMIGHHAIQGPIAFWHTQKQMYLTQSGPMKPHPYGSLWPTWPILYRPIWFKFEPISDTKEGMVQTILLIGNPWLAWCGLLAFVFCVYEFVRRRALTPGLIALFFSCSYLAWSLVHRPVQFLYYYLPAFMMLGFACIYALRKWPRIRIAFVTINILVFIYFYPVISGGPILGPSFRYWMWFASWR